MRLPVPTRLEAAFTLARRGLVPPIRPDKLVRQAIGLRRWGSTLPAALAVHSIAHPDSIAIADDRRELGYRELDARTNSLARGLAGLGLREGERVGLMSRNGSEFVESIMACAKLGADVLLLNTSFGPADLERVLARDRPRALVADAEFAELIDRAAPRDLDAIRVTGAADAARAEPTVEQLATGHERSPLEPPEHESRSIVLTSGTTGTPKGARVARAETLDPLAWFLSVVPLRARSVYQIEAPLFHAHGYGQLATGLGLGCKLVLHRRFDPERALASIERHRVDALVVVPVMLKRIVELPEDTRRSYDSSSLKIVLSSGSALPADVARRVLGEFGPVLYNLYGSTEVAWATIATPADLLEAPGTAGRAVPHTRLAVLGQDGRPLPRGQTGRVFVGHEMLFEGYTDGSLGRERSDGMMPPGDLGHLDSEGRLFIDSREDDMIISGGENVYPGEIETVLAEHDDIAEVAAVGVDDEQFGQRVAAWVVPRPGSDLEVDDVLAYARARLARYKQPREVTILDELPRNALGKVLKSRLRAS